MNVTHPQLRDRLAAEYVLGTLHGGARRRFEQLLVHDPGLRDAVAFWERELMPMAAPLRVAAPSPALWAKIEARVAPRSSQASARVGWFERWFGVRALGGAVAGLVVGFAVTVLVPGLQELGRGGSANQLPESYAGILQDSGGVATLLVSSRRHGRIVDIKVLRPVPLGPDDALVLWALTQGGAPLRLGVVPASGKGRIELPATSEQLLSKVGELAVSVAPKAAASAEQPAGPYILRGPCAKFW